MSLLGNNPLNGLLYPETDALSIDDSHSMTFGNFNTEAVAREYTQNVAHHLQRAV